MTTLPQAPTRPARPAPALAAASFGRRLGARLLDVLLINNLAVAAVITLVWGLLRLLAVPSPSWRAVAANLAWPALAAILLYALIGNSRGGTLGKRLLGLRVVDADGQLPGWRRGLLRSLSASATCWLCLGVAPALRLGLLPAAAVRPVLAALVAAYVVGYPALVWGGPRRAAGAIVGALAGLLTLNEFGQLGAVAVGLGLATLLVGYADCLWMRRDANGQTWHDKLAGTYVVTAGRQVAAAEQLAGSRWHEALAGAAPGDAALGKG